mmetsp:Transcript_117762/g.328011  ORF Transcript_117762/g.328011 Transcript_117762/m.328011 type:complete len:89 (-) Transcript_117762:1246-1512(-)
MAMREVPVHATVATMAEATAHLEKQAKDRDMTKRKRTAPATAEPRCNRSPRLQTAKQECAGSIRQRRLGSQQNAGADKETPLCCPPSW